jgi:hypothetical protein
MVLSKRYMYGAKIKKPKGTPITGIIGPGSISPMATATCPPVTATKSARTSTTGNSKSNHHDGFGFV